MNDREKELENTIEYLWNIIDNIDTFGDMAKDDDKLYRSLVEKEQKKRWNTGIKCDGYVLDISNLKNHL